MKAVIVSLLLLCVGCKEADLEHSYSIHLSGSTSEERVKTALPYFKVEGSPDLTFEDAQLVQDSYSTRATENALTQVFLAVRPTGSTLATLRRAAEQGNKPLMRDYHTPKEPVTWWINKSAFGNVAILLPNPVIDREGWMAIDERKGWIYLYSETEETN